MIEMTVDVTIKYDVQIYKICSPRYSLLTSECLLIIFTLFKDSQNLHGIRQNMQKDSIYNENKKGSMDTF